MNIPLGDYIMFVENKYKKWYDNIIDAAKKREISGYTEKHHIIPKSLGGSNDSANLVALTAREHYVCHWLLTKFVEETYYQMKMKNALGRFVQQSRLQERNLTSRQFERARKAVSEANTGRHYSAELRNRMSNPAKGRTPWNKGLTGAQQCSEENKKKLSDLYTGKSFEDRFGNNAEQIKTRVSEGKKRTHCWHDRKNTLSSYSSVNEPEHERKKRPSSKDSSLSKMC
jgi:hypothetical protein